MPPELTSADRALALLIEQQGLLAPEALERHLAALPAARAREPGTSLFSHLADAGALTPEQVSLLRVLRAPWGRVCADCGETTYLLPGAASGPTPCERCGGRLQAGAGERAGSASGRMRAPRTPWRALLLIAGVLVGLLLLFALPRLLRV